VFWIYALLGGWGDPCHESVSWRCSGNELCVASLFKKYRGVLTAFAWASVLGERVTPAGGRPILWGLVGRVGAIWHSGLSGNLAAASASRARGWLALRRALVFAVSSVTIAATSLDWPAMIPFPAGNGHAGACEQLPQTIAMTLWLRLARAGTDQRPVITRAGGRAGSGSA